jgi:hypothetical protein
MPDAVGDCGTGAGLCSGARSLADSASWRALVDLLLGAYGRGARGVLYRAPVWASVTEASMLSVPLVSLRCASFTDTLLRAWGGDLGTLYVAGDSEQEPQGGGGVRSFAAAARSPFAAGSLASGPVSGLASGTVSGFDAAGSAWLRRWGALDLKDALKEAGCTVSFGMPGLPSAATVPPECGFAVDSVPRAHQRFAVAALASMQADCGLAEALVPAVAAAAGLLGPQGAPTAVVAVAARAHVAANAEEAAAGVAIAASTTAETSAALAFLESRNAWEPSDTAVAVQCAFANHARRDAPAAVLGYARQLRAAPPEGNPQVTARSLIAATAAAAGRAEAATSVSVLPGSLVDSTAEEWVAVAEGAVRANAMFGQVRHPGWDRPSQTASVGEDLLGKGAFCSSEMLLTTRTPM